MSTQAARDLDEDTLARRRRVLGDDHPSTLTSANNLASDLRNLGEHQAARGLDEDTEARKKRCRERDGWRVEPGLACAARSSIGVLRISGVPEHE